MNQIKLQMDGNAVCATWDDFIDLQSSPAGFGNNIKLAIEDLCNDRHCFSPSQEDKDFCVICGENFGAHCWENI